MAEFRESREPKSGVGKPRRRRCPWPIALLLAVAVAVILVVQLRAARTDQQIANLVSFVAAGVAGLVTLFWFLFSGRFPPRVRLWCGAAVLLGVVLFASMFRIDHVNGTLVPAFRLRWSARPDEMLALPRREPAPAETPSPEVDLSVEPYLIVKLQLLPRL